ncbi:MAG: PIN domain-containing protein [Fimbriimonadales bacterium]|nr:PIN domain-containing protein [Fimbriimonadales bacterium]
MLKKSLIDTDIWIEILRGRNPQIVANALRYRTQFPSYTLSVVSLVEFLRGLTRRGAQDAIAHWRNVATQHTVETLIIDDSIAELAGEILGKLDAAGTPIGFADPLIAATTIHHELALVSGNTNHYQRISELGYNLELVNWREVSL